MADRTLAAPETPGPAVASLLHPTLGWTRSHTPVGTSKQESQRLPQADRVQYVLLPSALDAEPQAVLQSIRDELDVIYDAGGVLLLERRS